MKSLKEAYKNYFKVGAAVSAFWLDEAAETVKAHFDTVTAENEMKYNGLHSVKYLHSDGELHPETKRMLCHPAEYTTPEGADKIYSFAKSSGIGVRGHTLAWHSSYPFGYFEKLTPDELYSTLNEHFRYVSERYPDCFCWDVVNEAVDDKHGLFLRDTVYKDKFGEDYLVKLYKLARKHFPNAELICNDYNEFVPEKREKIVCLLKILMEAGVVDGVGCQAHIGLHTLDGDGFDNMRRTYEEYARLGLKIHVTEMDVNTLESENPTSPDKPKEVITHEVAEVYSKMFAILREYKDAIESVTFWGVSDKYSWLNSFRNKNHVPVYPLLFDENFRPKEAFERIVEF